MMKKSVFLSVRSNISRKRDSARCRMTPGPCHRLGRSNSTHGVGCLVRRSLFIQHKDMKSRAKIWWKNHFFWPERSNVSRKQDPSRCRMTPGPCHRFGRSNLAHGVGFLFRRSWFIQHKGIKEVGWKYDENISFSGLWGAISVGNEIPLVVEWRQDLAIGSDDRIQHTGSGV